MIDLVAVTQRYSKGRKDGPVDCVKKFLNLFLATSFVGIDSKKGHSMFLLFPDWPEGVVENVVSHVIAMFDHRTTVCHKYRVLCGHTAHCILPLRDLAMYMATKV